MEVVGIYGDVGSGKTLTAVTYAYELFNQGYQIYSNLHLKFEYNLITAVFFEKIQKTDKVCIIIDEIGLGGATLTNRLREIEEFLAQARKYLGEQSVVIYTTQLISFTTSNLKNLTNYIIFPELYRNKDDIPYKLKLYIYKRHFLSQSFEYVKSIKNINVEEIINLYDTSEIVDRIGSGKYDKYSKKYKHFIKPKADEKEKRKLIRDLAQILTLKEGCSIAEGKRLAYAIVHDL